MQPSDGFWDGVGKGFAESPWWALLGVALIIAMTFLIAKYIYPGHKEIKMREIDVREREAQNDADRIKANAQLAEQQRQTNMLMESMQKSLDASTSHTDVLVTEIHGARDRSKEMGSDVSHIRDTTDSTHEIVMDIKHHIIKGEGTD